MDNLIQIADYYTRLRIAGMTENEMVIFKKSLISTALINKLDTLKLLRECVEHFEQLQLKLSDSIESKIVLEELRSKGVRIVD